MKHVKFLVYCGLALAPVAALAQAPLVGGPVDGGVVERPDAWSVERDARGRAIEAIEHAAVGDDDDRLAGVRLGESRASIQVVTRRTSSTVVMPARTFSKPTSDSSRATAARSGRLLEPSNFQAARSTPEVMSKRPWLNW